MSASDQAVLSFLAANNATGEQQRLQVAMALAESMVRELKAVLNEWEATAERLKRAECENPAANN
ncbi:MAG TPA: hypothetical protein VL992_01490 [Tepidisphaeraceae bacterium]|nr:hypothetical protein [Tepidisphaeraceae bacterium]